MAVGVGTNAQLMLDGYNLSDFFRDFSVDMSKDILDATVFGNNGWRAKAVGLKHATASGTALYDDTTNTGSWDVLKNTFPSGTAGTYAWAPHGFALGNQVFIVYSEQIRFNPQVVVDDLIRISTAAEARERAADLGISLHALTAETSFPVTGTTVDHGAATTNGGVGTLHVSAIAGASPNVVYRVQHAAVSTYADLVTFTAVTAANSSQRIEVAAGTTVNRNLRMTITEGGTTTSVTGLVTFSRR